MDAYRERNGVTLSPKDAKWMVKKYKSHRRIKEIIDLTVDSPPQPQPPQPVQQPTNDCYMNCQLLKKSRGKDPILIKSYSHLNSMIPDSQHLNALLMS
jgi:hypothetical protein